MASHSYEVMAQALVDSGVDTIFGLMGDANLELLMCLTTEHGVRYIGTRHEATAVSMADGYARATGKTGVCTVTRGPGLTNTLTALTSVGRASTPVVLLAGDAPSQPTAVRGLAHIQRADGRVIGNAAGMPVVRLREGMTYQAVAAAVHRAQDSWTPSLVLMPTDVQKAREEVPRFDPGVPSTRSVPSDRSVREVVDLIRRAERPVVLAGRGAVRSGAREELLALAERCGAVLATSVLAKGFFHGDPYAVGISGSFSSPTASSLLGEADLVLAFGASLNDYTTVFTTIFGDARVVHVDSQAGSIGRFMPVDVGIVGDAKATAQAIAQALPERLQTNGYREPRVAKMIADEDRWEEIGPSPTGFIDPRALALRLDERLPADRVVVVDSGHHCGFAAGYMSVRSPDRFMFTLDFSSVGLGLGTALGAGVARPDTLTVLAIGDGGLMMNLGDVHTAGRLELPMLIVVWNDQAFGAEVHALAHRGMPPGIARFESPDLAELATVMGVPGHRAESLDQLDEILGSGVPVDGPVLIDCRVDPDHKAAWLREEQALLSDMPF